MGFSVLETYSDSYDSSDNHHDDHHDDHHDYNPWETNYRRNPPGPHPPLRLAKKEWYEDETNMKIIGISTVSLVVIIILISAIKK